MKRTRKFSNKQERPEKKPSCATCSNVKCRIQIARSGVPTTIMSCPSYVPDVRPGRAAFIRVIA